MRHLTRPCKRMTVRANRSTHLRLRSRVSAPCWSVAVTQQDAGTAGIDRRCHSCGWMGLTLHSALRVRHLLHRQSPRSCERRLATNNDHSGINVQRDDAENAAARRTPSLRGCASYQHTHQTVPYSTRVLNGAVSAVGRRVRRCVRSAL